MKEESAWMIPANVAAKVATATASVKL